MKGRVIDSSKEGKERDEGDDYGIGLECPNCGKDMEKVTELKIKAYFSQEKGKMETESEPSVYMFMCFECGYTEELKVE
jgi:uncharacterized Zn finger protein